MFPRFGVPLSPCSGSLNGRIIAGIVMSSQCSCSVSGYVVRRGAMLSTIIQHEKLATQGDYYHHIHIHQRIFPCPSSTRPGKQRPEMSDLAIVLSDPDKKGKVCLVLFITESPAHIPNLLCTHSHSARKRESGRVGAGCLRVLAIVLPTPLLSPRVCASLRVGARGFSLRTGN